MQLTYKPAMLMGRLANGNEADQGRRVHAVALDVMHYGHGRALCGAQPGRRSGGWDTESPKARALSITCPRCESRIAGLHAVGPLQEGQAPNWDGALVPAWGYLIGGLFTYNLRADEIGRPVPASYYGFTDAQADELDALNKSRQLL